MKLSKFLFQSLLFLLSKDPRHPFLLSYSIRPFLNDKEAKLIFENLYKIEHEFDFDNLEYDAKFEDLFFLVEKTLIEKIGVDIAGKLHTGRSRNDMEHTMFRIELRKKLISLLAFSTLSEP